MQPTLKIAIQKKGHLRNESITFLKSIGAKFASNEKTLSSVCSKTKMEIIFLRDDDIPKYINCGLVDFGIIGRDVIEEKAETINTVSNLGFSNCKLVIAIPKNKQIKKIADLQNKIIATSYPNILKKYLKQNNVYSQVVELSGSVEIAPRLGLADAVCDITQTGKSLKQNKLRILDTILESQAVLIESPFKNYRKENFIRQLI